MCIRERRFYFVKDFANEARSGKLLVCFNCTKNADLWEGIYRRSYTLYAFILLCFKELLLAFILQFYSL